MIVVKIEDEYYAYEWHDESDDEGRMHFEMQVCDDEGEYTMIAHKTYWAYLDDASEYFGIDKDDIMNGYTSRSRIKRIMHNIFREKKDIDEY